MNGDYFLHPANDEVVSNVQRAFSLPRFVAEVLVHRGYNTNDEIEAFLNPSLETDWHNPYEIPGIKEVADLTQDHIKRGSHIVVFGDFDLDGVSSTAVLARGLIELGAAKVTPFIPLRFDEGYGLTKEAFDRVSKLNPDLVITVDCGISGKDEVSYFSQAGIDLAITDHHEAPEELPQGVPIADPKIHPDCPSSILAGAGVALKLVQALCGRMGMPNLWLEYTDLACLGTIADLMPLVGENRALVAHGVNKIKQNARPCIRALLESSGAIDKDITSTNLSFSVVPRLNATGRMGDAFPSLELLMLDDIELARKQAAYLEEINQMRRTIEAELAIAAREKAREIFTNQRCLVVSGENWHEGVKGIVASKLVSEYGVPSIVFSIENGIARGSGRSVGQVNLFKAVENQSDILIRFGGHQAAVGVTLPAEKLDEFSARLNDYMSKLPGDHFVPRMDIDAVVSLAELNIANVEAMQRLAPFGQNNPPPKLLAKDVVLADMRAVGADKTHLSSSLSDGRHALSSIMFNCSSIDELMDCTSVVSAAFEVHVETWRGKKNVKAMLSRVTPARACIGLEACLNLEYDGQNFLSKLYTSHDHELSAQELEAATDLMDFETEHEQNRETWNEQASKLEFNELCSCIASEFTGGESLHSSQADILKLLQERKNTLGVMATGRGKSLVFQTYAVASALTDNAVSVFVYPLRSLISDQAYHLNQALHKFGVTAAVLTGETSGFQRKSILDQVKCGKCDILLTTPEYLAIHAAEIARYCSVNFVVIDEAHHVEQSTESFRPLYAKIGLSISKLSSPACTLSPLTLALSATAPEEVVKAVCKELKIEEVLIDPTKRHNISLVDQRNLKKKDALLSGIVATGAKTIVYVNSRNSSIEVAKTMRKMVPQLATMIGFYNAGLAKKDRERVEDLFRNGGLTVLVATSAFGEGVNIPDVRNVVLYHMPYSAIEFNQMCGRVGRDGTPSAAHLLFGRNDRHLNEKLLERKAPSRDVLASIYKALKERQAKAPESMANLSYTSVAQEASEIGGIEVTKSNVEYAIPIFSELDLLNACTITIDGYLVKMVQLMQPERKVNLEDSIRYKEGLIEKQSFSTFGNWLIVSKKKELLETIAAPLAPEVNS